MIAAPPAVYPWPIGVGPRYHPPAANATVLAGTPVGPAALRQRRAVRGARRAVRTARGGDHSAAGRDRPQRVQLPAAHDHTDRASSTSLGRAAGRSATCSASGASGSGRRRLLSFAGPVSVFVDGRRRLGDPRSLVLTRHAEIVLEVGGYVTPHSSYLFPKGA